MHPFLDQVMATQQAQILENLEETRNEAFEASRQRWAEEEAREPRADRYADETEPRLTGDAARERIAERRAEHEADARRHFEREREAEAELTPIQSEVAREMNLRPSEARRIINGDPRIPTPTVNCFAIKCRAAELEAAR